jgi:hypothetical protein
MKSIDWSFGGKHSVMLMDHLIVALALVPFNLIRPRNHGAPSRGWSGKSGTAKNSLDKGKILVIKCTKFSSSF